MWDVRTDSIDDDDDDEDNDDDDDDSDDDDDKSWTLSDRHVGWIWL